MPLSPAERAALTSDLERILETQDALVETSATAVERAYLETLGAVATRVKRLVRGLKTTPDGRIIPDLAAVTSISPTLLADNAPLQLIWREWTARLSTLLKLQADYGRRVGGGPGALWLGADRSALEALVGLWPQGEALGSGMAGRFYAMTLEQRQRLAQLTTRHVLGRLPQDAFERIVDQELGRSGAAARRLIHDETLGFARAAHEIKARQLGLDYFRYSGPDDSVTRPFCRRLVARILSRAEVDALDNGQTGEGTALIACGGYNCRHRWAAVSEDFYSPEQWRALRLTGA